MTQYRPVLETKTLGINRGPAMGKEEALTFVAEFVEDHEGLMEQAGAKAYIEEVTE